MSSTQPFRSLPGTTLFIGSAAALDRPGAVCAAGVEAVVCVAPELLPQRWPRDLTIARFPLGDDGENPALLLRRVTDFIVNLLRDDVPTLIVCANGLSRSLAVAAVSLARHRGESPDDVLREIASGVPSDVSPSLWLSLRQIDGDPVGNRPGL